MGRVSGNERKASSPSVTPAAASTANTARQLASSSNAPPSGGANTGATPITSMMMDITRAMSLPDQRSLTSVRVTTMLAAPPTPCSNRAAASMGSDVATPQSTLASV